MQDANLFEAQMQDANLFEARLEQANFRKAQLQRAFLRRAILIGANLRETNLAGANLREAVLSEATSLRDAILSTPDVGRPQVVDARWGGVNLATLKQSLEPPMGDELLAREWRFQPLTSEKDPAVPSQSAQASHRATQAQEHLELFRAAARTNRQLAVALQNQGIDDEAAEFAYHAHLCQRVVYRLESSHRVNTWRQRARSSGRWLFSWFLWLIAGYGYRPLRSVMSYLVIVFGFMGLFLLNAHFVAPHLTWDEALVLSVSSFHGRGFFSQSITLGDTYARLAALEAVFGLLIEISFIATFTQRFFGSK